MQQIHIISLLMTVRALIMDIIKMIEIYLQNYVARTTSHAFEVPRIKLLQEQVENVINQNIYPRIILNAGEMVLIRAPVDLEDYRPLFPQLINHYYSAIKTNKCWAIIPMDEQEPWINPMLQDIETLWQRPENQPRISENYTAIPCETQKRFKRHFCIVANKYTNPGFEMQPDPVSMAQRGEPLQDYPADETSYITIEPETSYPRMQRSQSEELTTPSRYVDTFQPRRTTPPLFTDYFIPITTGAERTPDKSSKSLLREPEHK